MTDKQLDVLDYLKRQNEPRTAKQIGWGARLKTPYPTDTLRRMCEKGIIKEVLLPCRPKMYQITKP